MTSDVNCDWYQGCGNTAALYVTGGCVNEHVTTVPMCAYCKTLVTTNRLTCSYCDADVRIVKIERIHDPNPSPLESNAQVSVRRLLGRLSDAPSDHVADPEPAAGDPVHRSSVHGW